MANINTLDTAPLVRSSRDRIPLKSPGTFVWRFRFLALGGPSRKLSLDHADFTSRLPTFFPNLDTPIWVKLFLLSTCEQSQATSVDKIGICCRVVWERENSPA
ncbi:hypothetical protein KM043_007878 [Ampulex compressa]|nr:hypothetical protein KM043_007878 [Ampulex compressa]